MSVVLLNLLTARFGSWRPEEKLEWKLEKDISLDQVLAKHDQYLVGYYRPRAISNGYTLVCSTTLHHHFVLDLMDMFEFQGHSAYIMQMPWPPAFSAPTGNVEQSIPTTTIVVCCE